MRQLCGRRHGHATILQRLCGYAVSRWGFFERVLNEHSIFSRSRDDPDFETFVPYASACVA